MPGTPDRNRRRLLVSLGAAVILVAILVPTMVAIVGDDDSTVDVARVTTSTADRKTTSSTGRSQRSTTTGPAGTADAPEVTIDPSVPIFPTDLAKGGRRQPDGVVKRFVTEVIGMKDPILGDFKEGDSRSGEVEVRAVEGGTVTTVFVRQLEDDKWWVVGAQSADIVLDSPKTGDAVGNPVRLQGQGRAFEGHINVSIRGDDATGSVIGTGFVTGGGDVLRPFDGEVTRDDASTWEHGTILLFGSGGEDGTTVLHFTAIRVRFG